VPPILFKVVDHRNEILEIGMLGEVFLFRVFVGDDFFDEMALALEPSRQG
jgi:hypothetical protein